MLQNKKNKFFQGVNPTSDQRGISKKSRAAPLRTGLNSVATAESRGATLNPGKAAKTTMPTGNNNLETRRFTLFSQGDSYVDVPRLSRFLHIETSKEGKSVLVCQCDRSQPIEWRRVIAVKPGDDLRRYAGFYGVPRLDITGMLWFVDPRVFDHNCKPVEP